MSKKIKIIAFCGPAGCGKDTIVNRLSKISGFHKIIRSTTRPPREGEVQGEAYDFYDSVELFTKDLLNGTLIEANVFNDWCYGTKITALDKDKINIGAFDPSAIVCMQENSQLDVEIYYLQVSDKTRLLRQLTREENPNVDEIIRRFRTDKEDFCDLENEIGPYYTICSNETSDDLSMIIQDLVGRIVSSSHPKI